MTRRSNKAIPRWARHVVDVALSLVYLIQMLPHRTGGLYHEWAGVGFVLLLVLHHVLNWRWLRAELKRPTTGRNVLLLVLDVALILCVTGIVASGLAMASHVRLFALREGLSVARSLHACLTYAGLVLVSLHAGLHLHLPAKMQRRAQLLLAFVCCVVGIWAFMSLGVADKITFTPSFPDGITPTPVLFARHLAFAASCAGLSCALSHALSQPAKPRGGTSHPGKRAP